MSFLLLDKDQFDTLGEVLAFIDSLEIDGSDAAFDADPLSYDGDVSRTDVGVIQLKAIKINKRKRRKLSSSTRLQQCKKAEILYLRKRVLELEEQMQTLKAQCKRPFDLLPRDRPNADSIAIEPSTTWQQLAEANYSARLGAEEENRGLKKLLVNQLQSAGVVSTLLQQQTALQVSLVPRLSAFDYCKRS